MRTFHNIKLLDEVAQDPFSIIGQRNYGLFQNYLWGFEMHFELDLDDDIKIIAERMPSIEEFVTTQIGENNQRTVLFDYYLGWKSEDSRELFELCIEKIREYEKFHPIDQKKYRYKLKKDPLIIDLRKSLKHMITRPSMYGFDNFSGMRAFLDGYFKAKANLN